MWTTMENCSGQSSMLPQTMPIQCMPKMIQMMGIRMIFETEKSVNLINNFCNLTSALRKHLYLEQRLIKLVS